MIQLVFEKFEELGSAYAVFRYLVLNDLKLGFRRQRGGRIGELEWRPPSPNRILSILRHPIYAGAYAYGLHRAGTKNPATGRVEGGKWFVPPEELPVLLHGSAARLHLLGSLPGEPGAAPSRTGRSVSPGACRNAARRCCPGWSCAASAAIAWRPGTRRTRGPATTAASTGGWPWTSPAGISRRRRWTTWSRSEVLRALEPAALDLSLRAIENVEQERKRLHDQWRQTLERARHEVARAERQYQAVEPENRLVARTLEARWEEALKTAAPGGGGLPSLPGEAAGDVERRGPGADPVPLRAASPRSGTRRRRRRRIASRSCAASWSG